ncbi:MAG: hypothetical protein CM15mP10_1880 [Actinomycetota bacterium]|nr:MAG: hypothetical protein CM15mP10_1880 [Actinomycetota bacterium]
MLKNYQIINGKFLLTVEEIKQVSNAVDFAKQVESNGAGEILLASMDKDGTKSGYDIDLLKTITE